MKNYIFYALTIVLMASCGDFSAARLVERDIEEANKVCPIPVERGIACVAMTVDSDEVLIVYMVDESLVDFSSMESAEGQSSVGEVTRRSLAEQYAYNPNFRTTIDNCKKAGFDICYRYISFPGERSFDITISSDELP